MLLARALCASGKVLLLDEPVTGLDAATTAEMYKLINKLNKEEKLTILMVSHDMKTALSAATHVLEIHHGHAAFMTAADYLTTERGRRYMGLEENEDAKP